MTSLYDINYQLRAHKRDRFIEFIKSLLLTPFILSTGPKSSDSLTDKNRYLEILGCIEELIDEHMRCRDAGQLDLAHLTRLVPSVGHFYTRLPLKEAFDIINSKRSLIGRRFVPPSFNDIRYLLNEAQIIAIAPQVELVTFDGDMTLYADGKDFPEDSELVGLIITLLSHNIKVAIVTAAGYPGNAKRYEERLSGLLSGFKNSKLDHKLFDNFYVFGGECNYLFKYNSKTLHLEYIPEEVYQPESIRVWSTDEERIQELLNVAESHLKTRVKELGLENRVSILHKSRAVGCNPIAPYSLTREQLDELALSTQTVLNEHQMDRSKSKNKRLRTSNGAPSSPALPIIPFCAFNGGSDVWVDIGNKLIGVKILREWFGTPGNKTLHVGDQFLSTGNDIATRTACCTIWITSPEETQEMLEQLTSMLKNKKSPKKGKK
ncbi:IMP-specific 5-nucleotidase [Globomyces pollinis-pini]|nr:IMP-specific 5-nucleotidase [Globomyces pollinis-pini]